MDKQVRDTILHALHRYAEDMVEGMPYPADDHPLAVQERADREAVIAEIDRADAFVRSLIPTPEAAR